MKHGEARFLSCMYVLSLSLLLLFAVHGLRDTSTVSTTEVLHPVIILDPGHGGMDGGATGADGTLESDLNLSISLKTDAVLGLLGENTLLTRDTDRDLSSQDAVSISQKKVSDIRNRVSLVNSHPDSILLSIHCNSFGESQYHGAQVFYNALGDSQDLAAGIQAQINRDVDASNHRESKKIQPDVYLMGHIDVPGVLVECGFLTNPQELSMLNTDAYQKKLAIAIAVAVTNHLSENHSGV